MADFKKGDRVRLSAQAVDQNMRHRAKYGVGRLGTVIGTSGFGVRLVWDGAKTPKSYHPDFLSKADGDEGCS